MTDPCFICGQYHKDDYPTIDPVKSWKEGYRAGVEALKDLLLKGAETDADATWIAFVAARLLAESSKPMEEKE